MNSGKDAQWEVGSTHSACPYAWKGFCYPVGKRYDDDCFLYSAILRSRADSLHSHMILYMSD